VSFELWSTVASIGTFLVIAATAIAAFVQLRHMRGSNSIAALTECREVLESEEFDAAARFVANELQASLKDPDVRRRLGKAYPLDGDLRAINYVGNFFESLGGFVRFGIIDKEIACAYWSYVVIQNWQRLAPALAILRRRIGPALWEQFEYLVQLSKEWQQRHPDGIYPAGMARIPVDDVWLEADKAAGIAGDSSPSEFSGPLGSEI
jgi:hypothetical protein